MRRRATAAVALSVACCASWLTAAWGSDVSVREVSPDNYEMTLVNAQPLSESEARNQIAKVAETICKGRKAVLGKYSFESNEALGKGVPLRPTPAFRFMQQMTCADGSKAPGLPPAPSLTAADDAQRITEDIKARTEQYFRLLAAKRYEDAYAQVLAIALGSDKATWLHDQQEFRKVAGDLRSVSIVAVTVYDNPPEAPEPGLYVAADFKNTYENVPYQCGYLVWFRAPARGFVITRLDIGHVTAEQLKGTPQAQWPELRRKLGCLEPRG